MSKPIDLTDYRAISQSNKRWNRQLWAVWYWSDEIARRASYGDTAGLARALRVYWMELHDACHQFRQRLAGVDHLEDIEPDCMNDGDVPPDTPGVPTP